MDSNNKNHILSGSDCNFIGERGGVPERLREVSDFSCPIAAKKSQVSSPQHSGSQLTAKDGARLLNL